MKINAHIFNDIIRIDHIDESIESEIKRQLSYVDKSKQYQLRRMRMNPFGASPALMAQLESESYGTLLKKEGNSIIVPSGFASLVKSLIPNATDHRKETGDQISLPWASANQSIQLRPYQEEAVEVAMCHAKGQLILMFDGSLKAVEDIAVNDLIKGLILNLEKY